MRKATTAGSLYRLIYRSREVIHDIVPEAATEDSLQRQLHAIVADARSRNRANNVTGALLYADAGFAQVLEGPREVLERTLDRIVADRRHTDVIVLSFTPTQRRSFPDWPMAFYADCTAGSVDPLNHLSETGVFAGPHVSTGSEVLRLLERLVQQEDMWVGA